MTKNSVVDNATTLVVVTVGIEKIDGENKNENESRK